MKSRGSLSEECHREWSRRVCARVSSLPFFRRAESIALYFPLRGEVRPWSVFLEAVRRGKRVLFPRISGEQLQFIPWSQKTSFDLHPWGLFQPEEGPPVSPRKIDCVFLPGIVFDPNGTRVGFGKGYYDRALRKYSCPKIGLAYECQIVPHLKPGRHDVPCDFVVSERQMTGRFL
ncbi:MAG: 5-formyltetrahydrofolate cyclo-ligase [Deltaproteobacteria bacterium]|nr:5-formyltetrahydrofolate cyclo-ligase [Deltaproteobacteria bacterium]